MNSFITIEWIHLFCYALTTIKWVCLLQLNEFIYFALKKIYEFIDYMNSYLYEIIILKQKNKKSSMGYKPCHSKQYTLCHTTTNLAHCIVFLQHLYYLYYMILMSEKMTSQTNTDEFIIGTTNKILLIICDVHKLIFVFCAAHYYACSDYSH